MVSMLEKMPSRAAKIRVSRSRQIRENREFVQNVEREMALSRLLKLLEAEEQANPANEVSARNGELSRIARLQSVRATYALATSTEMQREGNGAWIRKRYALNAQATD